MIVACIVVNKTRHFVFKTRHFGVMFGVWGIKKEVKMRPGPPQAPLGGPRSDFMRFLVISGVPVGGYFSHFSMKKQGLKNKHILVALFITISTILAPKWRSKVELSGTRKCA